MICVGSREKERWLSPLCIDIFKNSEIEHLDELRENLIRAKPRRVIIDSRRDD
jgi:hypothetical protein